MRTRLGASIAMMAGSICCRAVAASPMSLDREHQVKTAFIYNFAKFCDWDVPSDPTGPFVIGVYRTDAYGTDLDEVLKGKSVLGHPIVIEQLKKEEKIPHCHMAILGDLSGEEIMSIVRLCRNSGTVLVGESTGFARKGGTIGFVLKDHTVRFQVNMTTAKLDHVKLSSKLLSLSTEVF